MAPAEVSWIKPCSFISLIIGFLILIIQPLIGTVFLITTLSFLTIIYLIQTRPDNDERTRESPDSHPPQLSPLEKAAKPVSPDSVKNSIRVQFLDLKPQEEVHPKKKMTPLLIHSNEQLKKSKKSERELKERIKELERQVQILRQRLVMQPPLESSREKGNKSSKDKQLESNRNEEPALSHRAIQRLIIALDEKFEKGAIPQQLYQRLRDKYLTRMQKAEWKIKASSQRESQKSSNGD